MAMMAAFPVMGVAIALRGDHVAVLESRALARRGYSVSTMYVPVSHPDYWGACPELGKLSLDGLLSSHEALVGTWGLHELGMASALDEASLLQDENAVRIPHAGESMRDYERRAALLQALQGLLNRGFILCIDA
jgi:hypothetical protein